MIKINEAPFFLDFSQPLKWFEWYRNERKSGVFKGNLSGIYPRFEKAIKSEISQPDRMEIYNKEKSAYLAYIGSYGFTEWFTEDQYLELKRLALEDKNDSVNLKVKDLLVKDFFKRLIESGREAKDYLSVG